MRIGKRGDRFVNIVMLQAKETGVSWEAAKRVLWTLCREWELEHLDLVAKREMAAEGCDEDLNIYMKGLEYVLGGNEEQHLLGRGIMGGIRGIRKGFLVGVIMSSSRD